MTYKELLDSVCFEEIVPFIEKYHGDKGCLALYKIHYDMLCHLIPNPKDVHYKTATVSHGEQDEDWSETHLRVHPIEGQIWEGALTMELVIEPDVNESLAEIAACCLWHTSFYGFTEEQLSETFKRWETRKTDLTDEEVHLHRAQENIKKIRKAGGHVPTEEEVMKIPSFREKVAIGKQQITDEYWHRMSIISDFVAKNLPSDLDIVGLPVADLCRLFTTNHYIEYDYRSYCKDEKSRADYLIDLIDHYEAFVDGILSNALIVLSTSKKYPLLTEEMKLIEHIAEMSKGEIAFIVKTDDTLEQELRMNVAFYEYEKEEKQNGQSA